MAMPKRMRRMLEKYLEPSALEQDKTPLALQNGLARRWIERTGWAPGNYPIYQTTDEGRKALAEDLEID